MNKNLVEKELSYEIVGAFYTVYNALGYGFLESVYANALSLEQLFNYLRASRLPVALLLHFGPKPVHKRSVWTGTQFNSNS